MGVERNEGYKLGLHKDPDYYYNVLTAKFYKNKLSKKKGKTFIAWKKARHPRAAAESIPYFLKAHETVLLKLEIPEDAKRVQPENIKCRASKVKVLAIYEIEQYFTGAIFRNKAKKTTLKEAYSLYDNSYKYTLGQIARPTERFSTDLTDECKPGIHFFLSKQDALDYFW